MIFLLTPADEGSILVDLAACRFGCMSIFQKKKIFVTNDFPHCTGPFPSHMDPTNIKECVKECVHYIPERYSLFHGGKFPEGVCLSVLNREATTADAVASFNLAHPRYRHHEASQLTALDSHALPTMWARVDEREQ